MVRWLSQAPTDHHWQELAAAMGHPEWGADEDKATIRAQVLNRQPLDSALTEWAGNRTNQEILDLIGGRVPCGPVNLPGDLFSDPHVEAREMLVAVEQPSGRPIVQVASPIQMTRTPTGIHRRALDLENILTRF